MLFNSFREHAWLWLIVVIALICFSMSMQAAANTVGLSYSKVVDDTGWGVVANIGGNLTEQIDGELDVQLQGGDIIKGRYTAEVGISGISVFHSGNIKGYSLDGLGNELDIGAKGTVNIEDLDVSVGVFGRNASEFAGRTAQSVLVDENGFDADTLPAGLDKISPPPTGLKIVPGSSVNLLFEAQFNRAGISFTARGMPQLTGEVKAHQGLLIAQKDIDITEKVSLTLGGEVALQSHEGTIDYETAGLATLNVDF